MPTQNQQGEYMMTNTRFLSLISVSAICLTTMAAPAWAQAADEQASETPASEEIIVTGVSRATNRLDTSISVSALNADSIAAVSPRGTSEIFRQLPGIRSESSGGGGNSNISVRGLPMLTGGGQFVSLQEDGLPVLLFGDHNFAPADGFIKTDTTLARIESVRGGSSSTLTTNGNGAIINLISRTGEQEGGSILLSKGIDFNDSRVDLEYGSALAEDLYFHVGGHYQIGGDVRDTGFNAVNGGKFRASITKKFTSGFLRVFAQVIDKKDATFMPQPVRITEVPGSVAAVTAGATNYGRVLGTLTNSLPGLDAANQTLHGGNLIGFPVLDGSGNLISTDLRQGIHTKGRSFGGEFEFEPAEGLTISNKMRYTDFSGRFIAPFTHAVDTATNTLARVGGTSASFFNGPNAGQAVTNASLTGLTGNNLITEIALFDTELNDMGNFANDLRVTKSFALEGGEIVATAGYFVMSQNFEQRWHWGRLLTSTEDNPSIINVPGVTEAGVYTYNGAFGACCNILWDMTAKVDAVYGGLNATFGDLSLDGSLRRETMRYDGFAQFNSARNVDVNRDGTIGPAETGVPISDPATRGNIGGALSGTAYSIGANYRATDDLALFARYSKGLTWNFDRQFGAFSGGQITQPGLLRNTTKQFEAGLKWRESMDSIPGRLELYLTYFHGEANLRNFSITNNQATGNIVKADGVEMEANWRTGNFNLFGNATWTNARNVTDFSVPARSGLVPRRQADWIYNIGASYTFIDRLTLGAAVNGTSETFVDFENRFVQPAFNVVTAYVSFDVTDRMTLAVNANNLFDTTGFTEGDESRLFDTDGNGAYDTSIGRSITGRTISASLRYSF